MTAIVPHLQSRNGVFYYVRRGPKKVTEQPLQLNHAFGGQSTVRWSLHMKDRLQALDHYRDAENKFDLSVRKALQSEIASPVGQNNAMSNVNSALSSSLRAARSADPLSCVSTDETEAMSLIPTLGDNVISLALLPILLPS
jgi:hypothetical protein